MESTILDKYKEYCRYLRPFQSISFTDREMLAAVLQDIDPDDVSSITQLLGERRGVIRVSFKTDNAIHRLEESVRQKRLRIKGIPLGLVEERGHFHVVTLDNVPCFLSEDQVEEVMGQFGIIAGTMRDYHEYRGKKVETERRRVLYTVLKAQRVMPKEVDIYGIKVFVQVTSPEKKDEARTQVDSNGTRRREPSPQTSSTSNSSTSAKRKGFVTKTQTTENRVNGLRRSSMPSQTSEVFSSSSSLAESQRDRRSRGEDTPRRRVEGKGLTPTNVLSALKNARETQEYYDEDSS